MTRKYTIYQYIQQAEAIHGEGVYDYSKSIYINRHNPITIICKEHGYEFTLSEAKDHLFFKRGCPLCKKWRKAEEILVEKYKDYPYKFSGRLYEEGVYKKQFVEVTCLKHEITIIEDVKLLKNRKDMCICSECRKEEKIKKHINSLERQKEKRLLRKISHSNIPKIKREIDPSDYDKYRLPLEEVINRVKNTYGDHNDCSNLVYINRKTSFNFVCKKHNYVCSSSVKLMQEEPELIKCIYCRKEKRELERIEEGKEYIRLSKEKYNNKFDYSMVDYKEWSQDVKVICPEHGEFKQSFREHIAERTFGCPDCGADKSRLCAKTNYIIKCKDKIPMLYLVEMELNNEKFYKVGITVQSIKERFRGKRTPYNVKLISNFKGEAGLIYDLETKVLDLLKEYSYEPKVYFEGRTECFMLEDNVINIFKELIGYSVKINM